MAIATGTAAQLYGSSRRSGDCGTDRMTASPAATASGDGRRRATWR